MMRVVKAADRRTWTVRSRISWTRRPLASQFEHDMAASFVSGVAMLGVVVVLTLFVVFWTPAGVVRPAWFILLILLILLLMLMLWALQRPWIVTAHTTEPIGSEGEYWEGIMLSAVSAREEVYRVADRLSEGGSPNDDNGPLARVPSPESSRDS